MVSDEPEDHFKSSHTHTPNSFLPCYERIRDTYVPICAR